MRSREGTVSEMGDQSTFATIIFQVKKKLIEESV